VDALPLRRGPYLFAALGFIAVVIYGSLVPLHYEPRSWTDAVERFRQIPYLEIGTGHRADWVSNILLFIPLTYLWTGVLTLGLRSRPLTWLFAGMVIVVAAAGSVALEFTQIWFPPRTVSQNDIIAETIGAVAGALLWLGTGRATAEWLGRYNRRAQARRQTDWLLEAYFVGFLIYAVLPLDLTINSGELVAKFREGRITIVPFADFSLSLQDIYGVVRDVVVFIPIGMLLSMWRTTAARPVRSIGMTIFLGAIVAAAVESAQLLVLSRFASSTDVIVSTLGAAIGSAITLRWYQSRLPGVKAETSSASLRRTLGWLAVVAAYVLVLVVVFCAPFDVSGTREEWRARWEHFWAVPFANLYYNTEYNAVSDVLRKLLMFGGLGALSAITVRTINAPRAVQWLLLAVALAGAAGVSTGIELAQVFMPPHVSDITDVLIATVSATLGMIVALRWLLASAAANEPERRLRRNG
jgi:VanZ family protein